MADLWNDLLDVLELRAQPAASPTATDRPEDQPDAPMVFEGSNQKLGYHRLFGGQLLGQIVTAAQATCPDKAVKSLHVLFPRAGHAGEPVRYEVHCHQDGRTFATLTVVARQTSGVIACASVNMNVFEGGLDRQAVSDVPPVVPAEHRVELDLLPWETRSTVDLDSPTSAPPELDLWMRTPTVRPELAPALVAYATDLTLIGTALRPLPGVSQRDSGTAFTSAVTSHTVWFHRPVRTDDGWLLLRQNAPLLAHGRSFGRGDVFTESGSLVASYAQEALVRFQP